MRTLHRVVDVLDTTSSYRVLHSTCMDVVSVACPKTIETKSIVLYSLEMHVCGCVGMGASQLILSLLF